MAVETVQNEKEKIKVSPQGWLALVIMLCMFSGFFANMEGPLQFLRVLDLNTLIGSFGTIGDTGANFMGSGGYGSDDPAGDLLQAGRREYCPPDRDAQ